jgi:hypothetical protein
MAATGFNCRLFIVYDNNSYEFKKFRSERNAHIVGQRAIMMLAKFVEIVPTHNQTDKKRLVESYETINNTKIWEKLN